MFPFINCAHYFLLIPTKNSIAFIQICGFFERTKYYAIWTLTEVYTYCILRGTIFSDLI